jgi:hypothetical protein
MRGPLASREHLLDVVDFSSAIIDSLGYEHFFLEMENTLVGPS